MTELQTNPASYATRSNFNLTHQDPRDVFTHNSTENFNPLVGQDEEQVKLMDEVCIVIDENDNPIGAASKKDCHLMVNIDRGILHRGFGVYLFDSEKRLLLQQRALQKITFPGVWSNTCCSHPLDVSGERGSDLETAIQGVKRAAQRKLFQELGISADQVPLEKIKFLTRIHYKSPTEGAWGEHEIGYALLVQANVSLNINQNEIQNTQYVTEEELKQLFNNPELEFSPWFRIVYHSMLHKWWKHIGLPSENEILGDTVIQRMV